MRTDETGMKYDKLHAHLWTFPVTVWHFDFHCCRNERRQFLLEVSITFEKEVTLPRNTSCYHKKLRFQANPSQIQANSNSIFREWFTSLDQQQSFKEGRFLRSRRIYWYYWYFFDENCYNLDTLLCWTSHNCRRLRGRWLFTGTQRMRFYVSAS